MNFEWRLEKNKELGFDDKCQNLACFEIVLNIFRMKIESGDKDTSEELEALCGFALDCMFIDTDVDEELFDKIINLKDKKVRKFKTAILDGMGVPEEVMDASEVGEA